LKNKSLFRILLFNVFQTVNKGKLMTDGTALEGILDTVRKDVKTESYPMSIGELIGMYEKNEIILRPEYQRYFRWTKEQKSKLIETVLIGLPLPSFFMAQDENGTLDERTEIQTHRDRLDWASPAIIFHGPG
jgi:hypothetical protein